jgi:hypothetical protein
VPRPGQGQLVDAAPVARERNRAAGRGDRSLYARRWGIEPLCHNLKRWWGANNLWQQSLPALELWMHMRAVAWVLAQLLTQVVKESFPVGLIAPWRSDHVLTAGLIGQWLRIEFSGLPFRDGYDRRSRKFSFPEARSDPRTAEAVGQSPSFPQISH